MASWKYRFGLVVPDVNVVVEPELCRLMPAYISVHSSRAEYDFSKEDPLQGLIDSAYHSATELRRARVHALCFACTGASFYKGIGSDVKISNDLAEIAGAPATTTSTAVVNSLRRLGVERLVLATPYDAWINKQEAEFLSDNGFEVLREAGLGVRDGGKISEFTDDDVLWVVKEAYSPDAEAIFISCTNLETLRVIKRLTEMYQIPVLTSNLASAWELLDIVGDHHVDRYSDLIGLL